MNAGNATRRPYRMRARAEATAATRERILAAVETCFDQLQFDEITLGAVAERADVSVQTVLRHFGSRDGLFMATLEHTSVRMGTDRGFEAGGDVEQIVGGLVDHYEEFGDRILRLLAQEGREPGLQVLADLGRAFHVEWCKRAFTGALEGLEGVESERRIAQIAALTDIYVWKLLRRDRKLDRAQTKVAMCEMLAPLTEPSR